MRTINEVATWFKDNNILADKDELRIKILSLYTKVAYTISNIELKCTELNFENNDLNFGITDTKSYTEFSNEELQILKTINHVYGYEDLKYLILDLTHSQNINNENVTNHLRERIKSDLEVLCEGHKKWFVDISGINDLINLGNYISATEVESDREICEEKIRKLLASDSSLYDRYVEWQGSYEYIKEYKIWND